MRATLPVFPLRLMRTGTSQSSRGPRYLLPAAGTLAFAGVCGGGGAASKHSPASCQGEKDDKGVSGGHPTGSRPPSARRKVQVVTEGHPEYIKGIQIWGVGIKDDPIPGEKRGKGVQHLRSTQWVYAMACFIQDNFAQMSAMMRYALSITETCPGYDFRYFVNCSEGLFHKALDEGLQSQNSRDLLMMAAWCLMAAAEVSESPFYDRNHVRHSQEWRQAMRQEFYASYLEPDVPFVEDFEDVGFETALGKYGLSSCRFDLIPPVALERLDIHNELCRVKWTFDPGAWLREGFLVSGRVDSMHRHYWSIHARDYSEDHLAHGIWNLMALYHVIVTFPEKNDLVNFAALRQSQRDMLRPSEEERDEITSKRSRAQTNLHYIKHQIQMGEEKKREQRKEDIATASAHDFPNFAVADKSGSKEFVVEQQAALAFPPSIFGLSGMRECFAEAHLEWLGANSPI